MEAELIKAMNRIAAALEAQAEATVLLARATAGEFDDEDSGAQIQVQSLSDVPKRDKGPETRGPYVDEPSDSDGRFDRGCC